MEAWLAEHPGDPYTWANLGALEGEEGQKERGIQLLRQGLKQSENTNANPIERYELLLHLGIALGQDDPQGAVTAYREAVALPMDIRVSLGARLNLAALLMQQELLDEAITLTTTATKHTTPRRKKHKKRRREPFVTSLPLLQRGIVGCHAANT